MFKTPDLSQHFAPQPKPNAKEKSSPQPIPQIGKKGKANKDANAKMKKYFEEIGITTCELQLPKCWNNTALGFAHAKKRRFLSKADLTHGILICNPCHMSIEYLASDDMEKMVERIIKKRKIDPRRIKNKQ